MEKSGLDKAFDKIEANDPKATKNAHKYYTKFFKIEKEYDQEDEDMLIQLIKLRKSIWS
jgi:hypothetical protein